jgi:hypothetical protein
MIRILSTSGLQPYVNLCDLENKFRSVRFKAINSITANLIQFEKVTYFRCAL